MKQILLLLALFIGSNVYAQFGLIPKDVLNDVKQKKVLVELKNKDLQNDMDISAVSKEDYVKFVEAYNSSIQNILPKNWLLSEGDIEFKSPEEIEKIPNSDLNEYILFSSGWLTKSSQIQGSFLMYSFNIDYFNAKGKRVNIFELSYIPDELIVNADILFLCKVLNNHINASQNYTKYTEYFNVEKNINILTKKTLLLDDQLTKLSLEDAKKQYVGGIEIVNPERIAKEIEIESEDFVFIKMIWSNTKGYAMYNAFDTKECNILSCIGTGGLKVDFARKHKNYIDSDGRQSNFWNPSDNFQYRNPYAGEDIFRVTLFKSELSVKKVHLKTMFGKSAQKINCK